MPSEELIAAMGNYNEALMKAGVLVDLAGLQPTSRGIRVRYSRGRQTVIEGPFTETRELIAGYWIIQVNSREEAIEWAKRAPQPHGEGAEGEIELRPFFEMDDFPPSPAVERARTLCDEFARITQ